MNKEDIRHAEQRMSLEFPEEIVRFFEEIGYGFFYDEDGCFTDALMKPKDIADFRCAEGNYYYGEEREFLKPEDLVFLKLIRIATFILSYGEQIKGKFISEVK